MKERPILFSGPMVRAILSGSKTQTRRVIKLWPPKVLLRKVIRGDFIFASIVAEPGIYQPVSNQHGALSLELFGDKLGIKPGEFEWVCPYGRPGDRLWVRETWHCESALSGSVRYRASGDALHDLRRWKPSIHMPRWASRISLEVTGVRVERLQDGGDRDFWGEEKWALNPWVWAVEFRRLP